MAEPIIRVRELRDGALWNVVFNRPKANILDTEMVTALDGVFSRARGAVDLKAVCLSGEGDHFSYGASVEEHRPDQVGEMLRTFHRLFTDMADSAVALLAAVNGQCLGGGLEIAAFCHRIFASPTAQLGQPEIRLGVFAPVASVLLPQRVGRGAAEDLCLSGRVLDAAEARAIGLVDQLAEDPLAAAVAYFEEHLQPHSASSLRFAVRAARVGFNARFLAELSAVESLYLERLVATTDAREGIDAFLAKRSPVWRNA